MKKDYISNFEKICSFLSSRIIDYKYVLLGTYITAFFTYIFAFVHKLPNCDDIHFDNVRGVLGIDHGRWMLDVMGLFMPHYSMPWIYGILSIVILSVANCFIIKIFRIENKYLQVLISGLAISFQAIVGTLSYMFLSYMYAISFLLSVFAICLFLKPERKSKIWAVTSMVISMGFYQAYWAISVTFFIIILLIDIIESKKTTLSIIQNGMLYAGFICLVAILYYIINTLIFYIFDIEYNSYANDRVNNNWPISDRLYWTVVNMISLFFYGTYGFVVTWLSKFVHCLFVFFVAVLCIIPPIKKKKWDKALISTILLFLFPIGINCLNIITPTGTHSLTLITFSSLYVLVAVLIQHYAHKIMVYDVMLFAMSLLLFNNILIANKSYLKQYLQYENAKCFYTGVMVHVEQTQGFDENSKLALVGEATNLVNNMSDFTNDDITGITATSIINIYSRPAFLRNYVGFTIPFASDIEISKIKASEEFESMASYPYFGSVKKFGDVIVVKFSEVYD